MDRDIILRDCGLVGWLGILAHDGDEIYRTGRHMPTAEAALLRVQEWLEDEAERVKARGRGRR